MKKFICFVFIFMIFFSMLNIPISYSATNTNIITYTQVQDAVTFAKKQKKYKSGYCLEFIDYIWEQSVPEVSFNSTSCCATKACKKFRESTNRDDIPIGASVFFSRNKKRCSTCQNRPGHVGFYIGDNKIVHCYTNGKIKTSTIDEIIRDGYNYAGWGYHSGIELEREPIQLSPEQKDNSTLSINLEQLPTNLEEKQNFGLHGKINSNFPIMSVTGFIRCDNIPLFSTNETPYVQSFDIGSSDLNNKIKFATLPIGKYTLMIIAEDSTTKTVTLVQEFTVNPIASTLKINLISQLDLTNNIHTQGKNLGLYGFITSNYDIVRISGFVVNNKTKKRILWTNNNDIDNSETQSININKSNLNKDLIFGKLEPGEHTLTIYAEDSSGKYVYLTKDFTVVKNSNIVTGTVVNLNQLGWKNVSIRTGPSTNYKIVGSMTTGQKCTVALNKSTANWYYIEYNGIKGYVSKKGISI